MNKKATLTVFFPLGANFITNPELVVYNQYISFLKKLYCINAERVCIQCPFCEECRFFQYTGYFFTAYPGIIMKSSYFTKKRYRRNEEMSFTIFFIGTCSNIADSFLLFVREYLDQKIGGQFFCIKDCDVTDFEETLESGNAVNIISPVEAEDLSSCIFETIAYYNNNYRCNYSIPEIELNQNTLTYQKRTGYKVCGKRISLNGYIGKTTGNIRNIPSILTETGIGKNNCIGGGQIEIENHVE